VYAECAEHGTCDAVTGVCVCQRGYNGPACDDTSDHEDRHVFDHDGPFFSGSLMKVNAKRFSAPEFNLFQAVVNGENLTTIRGDGQLIHSGDMYIGKRLLLGTGIDNLASQSEEVALAGYNRGEEILRVDSKGRLKLSGGIEAGTKHVSVVQFHLKYFHDGDMICIGNGTFAVVDAVTEMTHARVKGSLEVAGTAHVEESLFIGSGFALTPSGMTVNVATHFGTLFELTSRQKDFTGSMLEINAVGNASTLIRGVINGVTTCELTDAGEMITQSLRMLSGGVDVQAGGVRVSSSL
jgi:hypothetical protein